ncbi:hypothetical protein I6N95_12860 [Vagococcus sp. BWB3-3]|uniref:DUF624 domain-containing protein n=1 Tax=Vagococcus allomyrinae TaxID=2794353 RepID=A0A940PFI7_9ENTE|nr:hypothetical protein [Vagococcus allomyrinae]MBP1041903.1 hypothetical protein [Vagococcus allomyrinae]
MTWSLKGLNSLSDKILKIVVLNMLAIIELVITLGIFGVGPLMVATVAVSEQELNFVEAVKVQVKSFKENFITINRICLYNILLSVLMVYTLLVIQWSHTTDFNQYRPVLIGMLMINLVMVMVQSFLYERYGIKGKEVRQNMSYLLLFSPWTTLKAVILLFAFSYLGYVLPFLVGTCLVSLYLNFVYHQLNRALAKVKAKKK